MLKNFFRLSVLLNVAAMLAYLAAVAYLGAFSRYMADDYCEAAAMQSSTPLRAVMDRYEAGEWRAANRYSNLLLAGVLESLLGLRSVAIILPLMVILWSVGLIYSGTPSSQTGWHRMAFSDGYVFWSPAGIPHYFGSSQSFSSYILACQHGIPFCTVGLS